jgi:diguanylate cyclase (GGDEF)-like protein
MSQRFSLGRYTLKPVLLIFSLLALFIISSRYNYQIAYGICGAAGIIIIWTIFLFTSIAKKYVGSRFLAVVGYSYLFTGIFELFHLTTMNFFSFLIYENRVVSEYFRLSGRILESMILLYAIVFTYKKYSFNKIIIFFLLLTMFFLSGSFVISEVPDRRFFQFVNLAELIIVITMVITALIIRKRHYNFSENLVRLLWWSLIIGSVSEMLILFNQMSLKYTSLLSIYLKLVSWYLLYRALITTGFIDHYNTLLYSLSKMKEAESEARRRAEARAAELDVLHANLTDILIENDSCRLLEVILIRAIALLKASGGELGLFDRKNQDLYIVASHESQNRMGARIKIGEGIMGAVAKNREPLVLTGKEIVTYNKKRYVNIYRSCMAVPLVFGGNLVGTVMVLEKEERRFSHSDLNLFSMFAQQAAIAIRNHQLLEDALRRAETDSLTGLYNHRHFFELGRQEILRAIRYGHPLTAIMLDIDHFKEINDAYGHGMGDQIICSIANICRSLFRSIDIVGRYGGEEFSILLPETSISTAREVAERLRKSISSMSFTLNKISISVTVSIGIASLSSGCKSINSLMDRADKALYHAKNTGRNRTSIWSLSMIAGVIKSASNMSSEI